MLEPNCFALLNSVYSSTLSNLLQWKSKPGLPSRLFLLFLQHVATDATTEMLRQSCTR